MPADHLGRTEKDFAIEFGEYLARQAEFFMQWPDMDGRAEALRHAIYEFRKRAMKADIPVHDHLFGKR